MEDINKKLSKLNELVTTFKANIKQYKSSAYDEANTRVDYIDKFFELLDWDVRNTQGFSEQYREVVREDKVIIQGKPKAPDYSFRIGGIRKFFVEAKKPAVNIKEDTEPAFQIRRYSYTAKLPLAILTDFEEFAVYDTRIKPNKDDKASTARIFYCTYEEYEKNFEFIYNTFSKTAILKGSFDRYIEENKNKKGTSEVDKEFLKLIEWWREILARTVALRNNDIDLYNLNYAVQKIIDRIIFLRIAEDRQMEEYGTLYNLLKKENIYAALNEVFKKADDKYNSGLFKIEDWLVNLQIDEKILVKIIKGLYYPDSPYEFSVLPIEILGHIYEQFLGKTIRLTKSHQAKVEEKPEVRKAGGVYYTPQYIVDYIVKNTVGEKIKNKSPKEIKSLRILDPACGSGSFLVGAYDFLLKYHLEYYTNEKNKQKALKNDKIYQVDENSYKLTIEEKQKILLNNIYGVDIDSQAVEVTKLSLLLKLMEDENVESRGELFRHSDLKLLPDLSNNIKCGNSLIGSDFFKDKNLTLFGDDDMRKINPFDWDKEFLDIFKNGGFDVVIGNPPWVDIKGLNSERVRYYFYKYNTTENRINLFAIFVEKSLTLLSSNGIFGFIIPNSILIQSSYSKIRKFILNNFSIEKIVRLPDNIFQNVKAESCILIIKNAKIEKNRIKIIIYDRKDLINNISGKNALKSFTSDQSNWKNDNINIFNIFVSDKEIILLKKIEKNKKILEYFCDFSLGITPYDKYKGHTQAQIKNRVFHSSYKKDDTYKELLSGEDIKRYYVKWGGKEYIKYGEWLGAPRKKKFFVGPKIFVRQIISGNPLRIFAAYTEKEYYITQIGFSIIQKEKINLKFILGIINSKLINFYHKNKFLDQSKNLFQKILIQNAKKFPIPVLDSNDKELQEIICLVEQMIDAKKKFYITKNENDKKMYQKKIEIIDKQIDDLVYKLYGLTDEEIKIVEGEV